MTLVEICQRMDALGLKPKTKRCKGGKATDKISEWYSTGSSWYRDTAKIAADIMSEMYGMLVEHGYDAKNQFSRDCSDSLEAAYGKLYEFMEANYGKERDRTTIDKFASEIEEIKKTLDRKVRVKLTMNAKISMKDTIGYVIDALDYASTEEFSEENKKVIELTQDKLRKIAEQIDGVIDVASRQAVDKANQIFALIDSAAVVFINGEYSNMDAHAALDEALDIAKSWVGASIPKVSLPVSASAIKESTALSDKVKYYALAAPSKRRLGDAITKINNRLSIEDTRLAEAQTLAAAVDEDKKKLAELQAKLAEISARHKAGLIDAVNAKRMCEGIMREATALSNKIGVRMPDVEKRRVVAESAKSLVTEMYYIFDNATYYANSAEMTVKIGTMINFEALSQVLSGNITAESKNSIVNLQELCELIGNSIQMSAEEVMAEIGKSKLRTKLDNGTQNTVNNNPFAILNDPAVTVDSAFVSNDAQANAESFMSDLDAMLAGAGFAGTGDIGSVTVDTTIDTDTILANANGNGNGNGNGSGSAGSSDI